MCVCTYTYMHICVCICTHVNNAPSRFSTEWLCGNSSTLTHELPQCHCGNNRKAHFFYDYIYIMPIFLL